MYEDPNVVAVKILVREGDSVLLVREPEFNDWMPGRLGLPGGKPLLGETLHDTLARKIETEVGLNVRVTGVVKIVNILMPEKTVYHLLVAAEYQSGEIDTSKTESDNVAWYTCEQIENMSADDFTEYYNYELIKQYLSGDLAVMPLSLLQTQDNRSGAAAIWMEQGRG